MRRASTSVHALVWRQIRTSTVVVSALLLSFVKVGLVSFNASGGVTGMRSMQVLLKNPAISALYGRAKSLPTAGSLVQWKMGMYLAFAVAIWSGLMATRVTRGGEDDETWDLLVVGRTGRQPALAIAMAVLAESGLAVGLVTFLTFLSGSQGTTDSLLSSLGIVGMAWCGGAIGVLSSQLFSPRRSATQVALSALGLAFILRMFADATASNGWIRWATPFGWLENIGAFQHRSVVWCAPLFLGSLAITFIAWRLQEHRDIGIAWWTRADRSQARLTWLKTPWRFAWRERRSTFGVWAVGLVALGLTFGYLTNALVQFCRSDPAFVKLLNRWGYGSMVTGRGFVSEVCVIMAVALGFLVVTMLCMVATDQVQGRLDLPLAFGTSRTKWMASAVFSTTLTTLTIALCCGVATWAGVVVSGTSMSVAVPLEGMLNALTTAPLIAGVCVLVIATTPRFSYIIMAALLSVMYIIAVLGPTLSWPRWLLDLSPFYHLKLVPDVATNWGATIVMTAAGIVAGALGWARFVRGDLAN